MKKINLVLCAAAIACTAFFASCDNGAKTYTDVTYENYSNTYNLVSFSTKEVVSVSETNAAGTAVAHDDETTETVWVPLTEPTNTGKNAATISWADSEVVDGFTYYYLDWASSQISGKRKTKSNGAADFGAEQPSTQSFTDCYFYKENDKYYYRDGGNWYEISGDPENATTISYTVVSVVGDSSSSGSWQLATAKNKKVTTTTTTYTIVLKASESL